MDSLNINYVCEHIISNIPPCILLKESGIISEKIQMKDIEVTGSFKFNNLFDFILCTISVPIFVFLAVRCFRKSAAVGFREMGVFNLLISLTLLTEIFVSGGKGFGLSTGSHQAFAIANMGLSSAVFFALLFNGFVGFQIWRDGGLANMVTLISGSLVFMTSSLLLGVNRVNEFLPFGLDNYSIMVAFLGFPAICILVYAICQSVLVVRTLGLFNPLLYVGFSALCVSLYSILAFAINDEVIAGCSKYVDGLAFGNLFLVIASILVYAYWNSITQSDSDKKY